MKRLFVVGAVLGWLIAHASGGSSPICHAYVSCAEATGAVKGSLDSRYGPMGLCWVGPGDAEAIKCIEDCRARLDILAVTHPDAGCRTFQREPVGWGL